MKNTLAVQEIALEAKKSSSILANLSEQEKNKVLEGFKNNLAINKVKLLEENHLDVLNAKKKGLSRAFIDRLTLNSSGIDSMVSSVTEIINQSDPVGQVIAEWQRPNGLKIKKVKTPIGVIAIIYESRPNVTADASSLSFKSGNPCILRCGKDSINSCNEIFKYFQQSVVSMGLPTGCVQFINSSDRKIVEELLTLDSLIDVVIPRGGKDLISLIQKKSRIPVFSHLEGIVHIYVDDEADPVKAYNVILNSKIRKVSICGAVECILIHENYIKKHNANFIKGLLNHGIEIRGDNLIHKLFGTSLASEDDWGKEYLDNILACKVVKNFDEAIEHISKFGSHHTDCIITENENTASEFFKSLDSSILLQNASTQFADGGEFGFGAEIGISTGKLHARGPIGLGELTTFQYNVIGNGSVRR